MENQEQKVIYAVDKNLLEGILNYLASKPYQESFNLIHSIQKCEVINNEIKEVELKEVKDVKNNK